MSQCNHFVVGGSNLLNGNYNQYRQWKLGIREVLSFRKNVAMLGVGWWQYQTQVNLGSRALWRSLLKGSAPHSVRDGYTRGKLRDCGVTSSNTSCPTTWELPDVITFPTATPSRVVTTITDYNVDPLADSAMLNGLAGMYDQVLFWPQGAGDLEYVRSLEVARLTVLDPNLTAFDEVLDSGDVEYVGTRLHAGIRALQRQRRACIIAIDNRAAEIGRETGLAVVQRSRFTLEDLEWRPAEMNLRLPRQNIDSYRAELASWLA